LLASGGFVSAIQEKQYTMQHDDLLYYEHDLICCKLGPGPVWSVSATRLLWVVWCAGMLCLYADDPTWYGPL